MFNEKNQELILWRIKPSIVRILTSIMELGGVPFKHCYTEEQLENILEGERLGLPMNVLILFHPNGLITHFNSTPSIPNTFIK